MTHDWILEDNRADQARDRLIDKAATLIRERGIDALDINELAHRAHCSRATVYRHVGGKKHIVEAVLARSSVRVVNAVTTHTSHMSGSARSVTAIHVALRELRDDSVLRHLLQSRQLQSIVSAAVGSPAVTRAAAELLGLDPNDETGTQWAIRGFISLVLWPMSADHEHAAVDALVAGLTTTSRQNT
ncbi:TetR/AcrR family transcriptional regulator [Gordonia polyisoprenivorans]|uniref:TetR/AcrR family transcriptional regulator n=1 Tax=Gordonia polyisoprenivorans TaxID=84595 RepID=UPI001AD7BC0A|nr:TetR/AcrR family transcriptional regulator [Gordonia polyisoprenivorans]QTI67264.1 helix-turn-helix transcriptional regulator [Gordonia polyisoprenivorans]